MVEHNLAKVRVASSSLVFRSCFFEMLELSFAQVAELVDAHVSGGGVYNVQVRVLSWALNYRNKRFFWRGGGIGSSADLRG